MELSGGDDRIFAAECILKHRKRDNRLFYYVKWKGWATKFNTWEPDRNILDKRLIESYFKALKKKRATQRKTVPKVGKNQKKPVKAVKKNKKTPQIAKKSDSRSPCPEKFTENTSNKVNGDVKKKSNAKDSKKKTTSTTTTTDDTNTTADTKTETVSNDKTEKEKTFSIGPPPEFWRKHNKIVDQIMVTDVTSNETTITVRECQTPFGFFKERTEKKSIAVSTDIVK